VEVLWHRDLGGPRTNGIHHIKGSNKCVWIRDDELRVILGMMSEVELVIDELAADPDGVVVCRVLGIKPV